MKLSTMSPMMKAVAIAVIHVLLVASLGAKLLYDRQHCPRTWFKAHQFDPDLPIRGRYLSLQLEVGDPRSQDELANMFRKQLEQQERRVYVGPFELDRSCGSLPIPASYAPPVAVFDDSPAWNCRNLQFGLVTRDNSFSLLLQQPVLYFIPETAVDPLRAHRGEQLWVLATVPKQGPPRPIALGVKKPEESVIHPLDLR